MTHFFKMADFSCIVSHLVELRQRRREHHEEKYKSTAVNVLCEKKGIPRLCYCFEFRFTKNALIYFY